MSQQSPYAGSSIILTTKHAKSIAIAPAFLSLLSANIVEFEFDTDKLGTFSGEIERQGSALDCAKTKCELGLNYTDSLFGLSSEGSFGAHPYIPFIPCDNEVLYFIDRKRNFHLHVSCTSDKTNYNMRAVSSLLELQNFAEKSLFPSHALIIRPDTIKDPQYIFKGIQTIDMLEEAFSTSLQHSPNGKVWVETDMRAHMNPLRMRVIEVLAYDLARRLLAQCPACRSPGFGKVGVEKGLVCNCCGLATDLIKTDVYGCVACSHQEKHQPSHKLAMADPESCNFCNP